MLLTTKKILSFVTLGTIYSCHSTPGEDSMEELELLSGTITYPFVKTNPLGVNGPEEKFVIKTIVGKKQYVIEIPKAGRDYDIEIPIAELDKATGETPGQVEGLSSPHLTDAELTTNLPQIEKSRPQKTTLLNKAFGTTRVAQDKEDPSYILGIAKINEYFLDNKFSYCLVEINYLLSHFPNSILLYKKKGTVLLKIGKHKMAVNAWQKALELSPSDKKLKMALESLREKIANEYYE